VRFLRYFAAGAAVLIAIVIAVPSLLHRDILDPPPGSPPVNWVRVLNTTLSEYRDLYGQFPRSLADLGPPSPGVEASEHAAGLVDVTLASGTKQGYRFRYLPSSTRPGGMLDRYIISAEPATCDCRVYLYSDGTGEIRAERDRPGCRQQRSLEVSRRFDCGPASSRLCVLSDGKRINLVGLAAFRMV
jgi:hypothetical protein